MILGSRGFCRDGWLALVLWVLLVLAPGTSIAESSWIRLRTPHFDVVSEASEEKSKEVLLRFEQLRLAMTNGFFPGRINPLPTRILMLTGSESVNRLIQDGSESLLRADGGYVAGAADNFILLDIEDDLRSGFKVSQHEYVHLLTRNMNESWPLWLTEGFASCFESAAVEKKKIVFGKPRKGLAEILRERRGLDLEQVFGVRNRVDLLRMPATQSRWFYPESWLLTHYLLFGLSPEEEAKLGRFFGALGSGSSSEEAVSKTFGWPVPELQKRLDAYSDRGRFRFREVQTVGAEVEIRTTREAASTSAAWMALMQLELGREDSANMALEFAVREGGDAWTELALGVRESRRDRHDAAVAHYRKALAAEPDRPQFRFFLAHELASGGKEETEEAQSLVKGSLSKHPSYGNFWRLLGRVERGRKGGLQSALDAYTKALDLNPLDLHARFSAALVLRDAGEKAHAKGNLQQVVRLAKDPILLAAAQAALKELEKKP